MHFFARAFDGGECGADHFWEFAGFAGVRGPLHLKRVASQSSGVAVALEGPGGALFSALVLDAAEWEEIFSRRQPGLFCKFSLGCGEFVFAGIDFAFGHEPRASVFFCPEWSA